jgi:DhnA family fructose-bisphosphate aldolase class Ia
MTRMNFSNGGIVIAMDPRARTLGVVDGLEDPGAVFDRVIRAGADAIMTSYGVIKHYRSQLFGRIPTFL